MHRSSRLESGALIRNVLGSWRNAYWWAVTCLGLCRPWPLDRKAVERGQMRALIVESLFGPSGPWHKLPFDPVPSDNLKRSHDAVQNTDQVKAPVCGRAFPLQSVSDTRQCAEVEASRSDKKCTNCGGSLQRMCDTARTWPSMSWVSNLTIRRTTAAPKQG